MKMLIHNLRIILSIKYTRYYYILNNIYMSSFRKSRNKNLENTLFKIQKKNLENNLEKKSRKNVNKIYKKI